MLVDNIVGGVITINDKNYNMSAMGYSGKDVWTAGNSTYSASSVTVKYVNTSGTIYDSYCTATGTLFAIARGTIWEITSYGTATKIGENLPLEFINDSGKVFLGVTTEKIGGVNTSVVYWNRFSYPDKEVSSGSTTFSLKYNGNEISKGTTYATVKYQGNKIEKVVTNYDNWQIPEDYYSNIVTYKGETFDITYGSGAMADYTAVTTYTTNIPITKTGEEYYLKPSRFSDSSVSWCTIPSDEESFIIQTNSIIITTSPKYRSGYILACYDNPNGTILSKRMLIKQYSAPYVVNIEKYTVSSFTSESTIIAYDKIGKDRSIQLSVYNPKVVKNWWEDGITSTITSAITGTGYVPDFEPLLDLDGDDYSYFSFVNHSGEVGSDGMQFYFEKLGSDYVGTIGLFATTINDSGSNRNCEVTLTYNGKDVANSIAITQKYADIEYIIEVSDFSFSTYKAATWIDDYGYPKIVFKEKVGGTTKTITPEVSEFTVSTNVDWLRIEGGKDTTPSMNFIKWTATTNSDQAKRSTTITVSYKNTTKDFMFTQGGNYEVSFLRNMPEILLAAKSAGAPDITATAEFNAVHEDKVDNTITKDNITFYNTGGTTLITWCEVKEINIDTYNKKVGITYTYQDNPDASRRYMKVKLTHPKTDEIIWSTSIPQEARPLQPKDYITGVATYRLSGSDMLWYVQLTNSSTKSICASYTYYIDKDGQTYSGTLTVPPNGGQARDDREYPTDRMPIQVTITSAYWAE